jgi:hypothetical protein
MTVGLVWPLHQLTELNILDGCELGLLNPGGAATIRAQLATLWEGVLDPADEIATFKKAGRTLWSELTCWAAWRPCSEPLIIQRVMAAADLDRVQGPLDATRDGARELI